MAAEAQNAFETDEILIIPANEKISDIKLKPSHYGDAEFSKLLRYISKDLKTLSKKEIKILLSKCNNIE